MTENYIIFIEQPLRMNLLKIITSKLRGKAIFDGITWEPQHNTHFHVVNKNTGEVRGAWASAAADLGLELWKSSSQGTLRTVPDVTVIKCLKQG